MYELIWISVQSTSLRNQDSMKKLFLSREIKGSLIVSLTSYLQFSACFTIFYNYSYGAILVVICDGLYIAEMF